MEGRVTAQFRRRQQVTPNQVKSSQVPTLNKYTGKARGEGRGARVRWGWDEIQRGGARHGPTLNMVEGHWACRHTVWVRGKGLMGGMPVPG
jgi:hypothetical protein